ncbi:helix-turn-helix transcriptional regulator [Actinomadura nitritigenes]|uniref:Helix-turn-helix domain-containing protein n=1 Tax=Actinomadura nitritigenes TaxID=134602 RepID=A0ABS3R6L1_9ACTN|nr:helix-turn-helix transcriptional regulator [Actinomadura nitritigenes]MBO2441865.1 helix-turn-helix domain-containing protein [Actinomadura nitritigenes]
MAARKPTSKTVAFGAEVTRLREEAGLNRTELAARSAVTRSYISQVESGRTKCRRDFAERLDKALDTGTALVDAWDELLRSSSYPKFFADFPCAEASADALRAFETRLVYGLLQTEAYASVLMNSDEAVRERMQRQKVLTKPYAPTVFVVLDESVLLREVGSAEIMREQLEHLIDMSERDNITIQIALIGYYRDARAPFVIATQPDRSEIVYLESNIGGETSAEPRDLALVSEAFSRLQAAALSPMASVELMRKVVRERWT